MNIKFFAIIIMLITIAGCSGYRYISKAPVPNISIDGKVEDWNGKLKYIEEAKSAIGVANDSKNIFVAFTTTNRANVANIIRSGLIIWFKPENGRTIGIQYPFRSHLDLPEKRGNRKVGSNQFKQFRIINEDKFPLATYRISNVKDINLAMSIQKSFIIYELKIPLNAKDNNYNGVQAQPGELLKIEIETLPFNRQKRLTPGNMRNDRTERRRSMGRGGSMGQRLNDADNAEINFELEVQLSK